MSKESLEWLNRNTLIGFTDKRSKAWHYRASEQGSEPNHYPGAIPVADVKRRLFSWQALELPISIEIPTDVGTMTTISDEGMPIRFQRVPGRKAIAASDDYSVLGVFKDGYQPHQYEDWLLNNVAKILDDNLSISSAGLLRNRAVAWVEVSVPDNITTPEGVVFRPNLLATTSFDGSLATTFKRTITETVCDNTMSIALTEKGGQLKFRHSRNSTARIADARAALDIVYSAADDFSAQVARLTSQRVTEAQWQGILDKLVPNQTDSKRGNTMADTKRAELNQLYFHDDRVAPWKDTAFGIVQAFNTWEQHTKSTKGVTVRVERNLIVSLDGSIA